MPGPDPGLDDNAIETGVGAELLAIYSASFGVGAEAVSVELGERSVVVCLEGLELLRSERILIEAGDSDAVAEQRCRFQRAVEAPSRAAVERLTGRGVVSAAATTELEPPHLLAVFRLGPRG